MILKNASALVLAFVLACNLSTVSAAEATKQNPQPNPAGTPVMVKKAVAVKKAPAETRYQVVGEYVSLEKAGFTQPKYSGPASLNGLGLKSAAELGLTGKDVLNEYEHSARVVKLSPVAMIYYDTASMEPLYLQGCLADGKLIANRMKLVTPVAKPVVVAPTPAPAPAPVAVVMPRPAPRQVTVAKSDSGYNIESKSARGNIVIVPAIRLLTTVAVIDVKKPTGITSNGRPVPLDPALTPADGYPAAGN